MTFSRTSVRKIIGAVSILCAIIVSFSYYILNIYGKNDNAPDIDYVNGSYVEFIDVGQGDCALLASKGKYCLIDTGNADDFNKIKTELKEKGIRNIDLIIISHYHSDHTGSLQSIVDNFSVSNLMYPPQYPDTNVSNDVLYAKKECIAEDGEFHFAKTGTNIKLGDFTLTVLLENGTLSEENNRSLYIMAKIGERKFFFTGDGEIEEENLLLKQDLILSCDVLKVPHHGGRTSSSNKFLSECKPKYSVISCAENNIYKHPHKETISRLKKIKSNILITKNKGDILFAYNDNELSLITEK